MSTPKIETEFKEPWTVAYHKPRLGSEGKKELLGIITNDNMVLIRMSVELHERVAACINACAGVPTEQLQYLLLKNTLDDRNAISP